MKRFALVTVLVLWATMICTSCKKDDDYKLYEWLQSENAKSTIEECGLIPK